MRWALQASSALWRQGSVLVIPDESWLVSWGPGMILCCQNYGRAQSCLRRLTTGWGGLQMLWWVLCSVWEELNRECNWGSAWSWTALELNSRPWMNSTSMALLWRVSNYKTRRELCCKEQMNVDIVSSSSIEWIQMSEQAVWNYCTKIFFTKTHPRMFSLYLAYPCNEKTKMPNHNIKQ